MKNQKGFTLIELIVVIAVLGILAVVAAPKFMDVQTDAKASVISSLGGSIESSADVFALKVDMPSSEIEIKGGKKHMIVDGQSIEVSEFDKMPVFSKNDNKAIKELSALTDAYITNDGTTEGDFTYVGDKQGGFKLLPKKVATTQDCYVEYKVATTANEKATFTTTVENCD